jgi:hypothetical protein
MATTLKDPPSFVTNIGAWEYTLAKLAMLDVEKPKAKPRLDEGGNPINYGQAVAIYKAVVKKYPHLATSNVGMKPINMVVRDTSADQRTPMQVLTELADKFSVGSMFWYDDVLCEAVERQGNMAVFPDAEGFLLIQAKVLEVDPQGAYRNWPVGKIFEAQPHRCFDLMEA